MFDPKQMYLAKTIYGKLAYVISIHIILVYIFSFFFISRIFFKSLLFSLPLPSTYPIIWCVNPDPGYSNYSRAHKS